MQSSKILTAGEGGVLLCKTPELAAKASSIINCGRPNNEGDPFTFGANYRMTELQSALGIVAIERFPEQARQREEMAAYLDESLSEVPGIRVLKRDPRLTARAVYAYTFAVDPEVFGLDHYVVSEALRKEGIPCSPGYQPMHRYELFQPQLSRLPVPSAFPERFRFEDMRLPDAERIADREALWLGEATFRAGKKGINDVVNSLQKIYTHRDELVGLTQS